MQHGENPEPKGGAQLRCAQRWSGTTLRMPHGQHPHLVSARDVVDVIASPLQQDATCPRHWRLRIQATDLRCVSDDVERDGQFIEEQVWCSEPIPTPPVVDFDDLSVGFGCGLYRQAHRRRRSLSRIADAGRRCPASADFQDADSASCRARRSPSVRSSPSSSATRSTIVPSGRVVGSSKTSRPFSTRARRGLMWLLYGFLGCSASVQRSRCAAEPVHLLKPSHDLVPTGMH